MNIHAVLFFILLVTLYRLFYRPHVYATERKEGFRRVTSVGEIRENETDQWFRCASSGGFRCEDDRCDCQKLCPNRSFQKKTLFGGEDAEGSVVVDGVPLSPGTYCLAKDSPVRDCDLRTSLLVYTSSGWACRNKPNWKNNNLMLCKSDRAIDNDLNRLVDVLHGGSAAMYSDVDDLSETFRDQDGREVLRYRCRCDSLDDRGNRMIDATPHQCLPDYCVREFKNVPGLGWNGRSCGCGPFPHAVPGDVESPCVPQEKANHWDENAGILHGTIPCMRRDSLKESPIPCPPDRTVLKFNMKALQSNGPLYFVRFHKDSYPSVTDW